MTNTLLTTNTAEASFGSILQGRSFFHIPPFQRPYRWKKERVEQLINDAILVQDREIVAHFLGAFIINQIPNTPSNPTTYEVIDGQQRLTTLYLLISAVVKTLLKNKEPEKAGAIAVNCLFTNTNISTLVAKLVPSIPDRHSLARVLNDLLNNGLKEALSPYKTPVFSSVKMHNERQSLIWATYQLCCKNTADIFKNHKLIGLESFLDAVQSGLNVIQIIVQDPLSGPKIFDSLNSNQEPMTTGDLVRNEVFRKISQSDPHLAEQSNQLLWIPFYDSFRRNNHVSFEEYFFPYGLIQRHTLKKTEIYTELRKIWLAMDYNQIIDNLKLYSTEFQDLIYGENQCGLPINVANCVMNLYRLKSPSSALPFLMKVCHEVRLRTVSEAEGEGLLRIVESFLVRRALCGIEPTGLHAVFKSLWNDMAGTWTVEKVKEIIGKAHTVEAPDDNKVLASFNSSLYEKKKIQRYFLFEYDRSLGADPSDSFETFQIEHILPQTYHSANWIQVLESDHRALKDLAGNLVPLSSSMNKQVGQSSYDVKKLTFKADSVFKSARVLEQDYPYWDAASIKKRNTAMANWAISRWRY